jgi:hypothetical protein
VALPSDLIRDTRTTPFNIGRRIELTDFTAAEAAPLARGCGGRDEKTGAVLLRRVSVLDERAPVPHAAAVSGRR